jgi:LPXTG-motif cell wall-anchored protein
VRNSGDVTLTLHDLDDDQLGSLLSGYPYGLGPGESIDTVTAGETFSATVMTDTVNVATWTAYNQGPTDVVSATSTALVTVTVDSGPTSVSVSGFNGDTAESPMSWMGAVIALVSGLGLFIRRRFAQ